MMAIIIIITTTRTGHHQCKSLFSKSDKPASGLSHWCPFAVGQLTATVVAFMSHIVVVVVVVKRKSG
jgi:hypothetical protein